MMSTSSVMVRFAWWIALGSVALCSPDARAQGWGSLKVTFVYDGDPPKPMPLQITKDQQFCGQFQVVDESKVVNPENKGLANVVGFLYVARTDRVKPQTHPDCEQLKAQKVKVDNEKCRFAPHIAVVWTEQTVELGNSDDVAHNTNIATLNPANPPINQLIPAKRSVDHKFKAAETLPIPVSCNIHPWMKGYLVIRDNPYAAVSDKDGVLAIDKLPAGKWKFRFWQESIGYVSSVKVDGKPETWTRGEVVIEIKEDQTTDLGTVYVPPSAFKQ